MPERRVKLTRYCRTESMLKLPGAFEIHWVRQYLVNVVLFEIMVLYISEMTIKIKSNLYVRLINVFTNCWRCYRLRWRWYAITLINHIFIFLASVIVSFATDNLAKLSCNVINLFQKHMWPTQSYIYPLHVCTMPQTCVLLFTELGWPFPLTIPLTKRESMICWRRPHDGV